jgi:putative ATP-dependent endonuclease of OLD family
MLVSDGEWPPHLAAMTPTANTPKSDLLIALQNYLSWAKARGGAADLLSQCTSAEMPATVKTVLAAIKAAAQSPPTGAKSAPAAASAASAAAPPPSKGP